MTFVKAAVARKLRHSQFTHVANDKPLICQIVNLVLCEEINVADVLMFALLKDKCICYFSHMFKYLLIYVDNVESYNFHIFEALKKISMAKRLTVYHRKYHHALLLSVWIMFGVYN